MYKSTSDSIAGITDNPVSVAILIVFFFKVGNPNVSFSFFGAVEGRDFQTPF